MSKFYSFSPTFFGDEPRKERKPISINGDVVKYRDGLETSRTGIDDADGFSFRGNSCHIEAEGYDRDRGVTEQYVRVTGDDGRPAGTYIVDWAKTGPGEMTIQRTRRTRD